MTSEGMVAFFAEIGVCVENAESLVTCHLLGFRSFRSISASDFENAMKQNDLQSLTELYFLVRK